jgi:hypothetical protein
VGIPLRSTTSLRMTVLWGRTSGPEPRSLAGGA